MMRRPTPPKFPRRSRTLPLKGTGDDAGKWYRCWYCGFICNVERDELGDSDSSSGVGHIDYHSQAFGNMDATDSLNRVAVIGGPLHVFALMELDADGSAKGIRHDFKSDISTGCPFCGSKNWRGDY